MQHQGEIKAEIKDEIKAISMCSYLSRSTLLALLRSFERERERERAG